MKAQFYFFFLFCIALLLQNCASLTGYQDGRACGKNNGEIFLSGNLSQSPDFSELDENSTFDTFPKLAVPIIEIGGRYGITEKVDLIGKANIYTNISLGVKAQVHGDRTSKTALSVGAEFGTIVVLPQFFYAALPLNFSVHPLEGLSWYVSPRVVYQSFQSLNGATYLGGNTGLLIGRSHQFAIDFGYSNVILGNTNRREVQLYTFGFGGIFKLGKNKQDAPGSNQLVRKKNVVKKG